MMAAPRWIVCCCRTRRRYLSGPCGTVRARARGSVPSDASDAPGTAARPGCPTTTHGVRQDQRVSTPPFASAARATRSVESTVRRWRSCSHPCPSSGCRCGRARGRVLAEAARRRVALPAFDNSAMDGYAVRRGRRRGRDGGAGAAARRRGHPRRAHGRPRRCEPGTAHRIMTGAPLPAGADVVVQVELTDGGTDVRARSARRPPPARTCGGRARTSPPATVVLTAGHGAGRRAARRGGGGRRARPCRCAAGRACSCCPPAASWSRPGTPAAAGPDLRVELGAAGRRGGGGRRRRRACCTSSPTTSTSSSPRCSRDRRWPDADLLLTSGGVSAGAYEVVKDALRAARDRRVRQGRDAAGRPAGRGTVDGVPVVTLPGNPVSSFVSFEVFVRPALRAALGHPHPERPRVVAARRRADAPRRAGGSSVAACSTPRGHRRRGRRGPVAPGRPAGAGQLPVRRPRGHHRTGRRAHPSEVWLLEGLM